MVLAIDIREAPERVADWVKVKGITMPVLLDRSGSVTVGYSVTATPTVVLIGRDGRLVGRAVGPHAWDAGPGRALLDALLAAPSPSSQGH